MVDIQNDFSPTGSLPVKDGNAIIPFINEKQQEFDLIIATQDWHPADHGSFGKSHHLEPGLIIDLNGIDQILWPVHYVQNTFGAEFIKGLNTSKVDKIFKKGINPDIDSYSGFFDNDHQSSTGLSDYLRQKEVTHVVIAGLATDYCVKYTAIDAIQQGFETSVLTEGCRGVNLSPGDVYKAFADMRSLGIKIC